MSWNLFNVSVYKDENEPDSLEAQGLGCWS